MRNIIAAIDFSRDCPKVVDCAASLARHCGAHLWLIHVAAPDPAFVGYEPGPQSVRDTVAREMRQEHVQLQEQARQLRSTGLEVTALLIQGPTVEALVKQADHLQADLIVAGTHGHGALYHLWMGSVGQGLIRAAHCPVVVVPAGPPT